MEHPGFFKRLGPFRVGDLVTRIEAEVAPGGDPDRMVADVRPLADARAEDLTFVNNRKYMSQLSETRAGCCLISPAFQSKLGSGTIALLSREPYRSFALALAAFYPEALRPSALRGARVAVDPSARIEEGATIEPGAVVGPEAWIGRGAVISAGAVIGYRVTVGRDSYIGPQATIIHALIGDRVIIHPGVRIGQDGFGFAMGRQGHLKVPQVGRVIIQDDVEIGANTTIDRGALKDTIIGEGTKIDNLVQIGHNVVMGRHCVIVAQTGISGSAELGDFVVMGGQSGLVGHIKVGAGAQIAGASHVKDDVPPGARMGGTPARPLRQWARELAWIKRNVPAAGGANSDGDDA
jgi:UDP-3-O-[3-hydroxymyristoyl] glucosamine N-acyltransferase